MSVPSLLQANQAWDDYCQDLSSRIPIELSRFALKVGWVKDSSSWQLPQWLDQLIQNTQRNTFSFLKIEREELSAYGFTSFHDAVRKLSNLEKEWGRVVGIGFDLSKEPYWMTVRFTATEVRLKRSAT